jgi:hypothetical protein
VKLAEAIDLVELKMFELRRLCRKHAASRTAGSAATTDVLDGNENGPGTRTRGPFLLPNVEDHAQLHRIDDTMDQ